VENRRNAQPHRKQEELARQFGWLVENFDFSPGEIARLLPTIPGGLTSNNSYYVNTLLPNLIFQGREQTSIPMTPGRWYLIPLELVEIHPRLREAPKPLAAAHSMFPDEGPRTIAEWPTG
jgi:hypothetical protein